MRIGALATAVGTTAKTIRFYEQEGLLPEPERTASGYRDYRADAARRLAFIRSAQAAGLTLAEIRGVLAISDSGEPPCAHVTDLIGARLDQVEHRIAELRATRHRLRALAAVAAQTDPVSCAESGLCHILFG